MPSSPAMLDGLTHASRELATVLFARRPELAALASTGGGPGSEAAPGSETLLRIEIPSPTGDPERCVLIWMLGDAPSVHFGTAWHDHASLRGDPAKRLEPFLDVVEGILDDYLVLAFDIGGQYPWHYTRVDLREPDALLEELTHRMSPGRVRLVSYSGAADREVGLHDLSLDSHST